MKKRLFALLAVIGFCVMVGLLVASSHPRGSVYQGKTVKAWLFQLIAPLPEARAQAEAAFEALGTNAVPELTRLARAKDAGWRKLIWVYATRLPRGARGRILQRVGPTNACVIRPMAAQALGRLGLHAAPAVPALIQMMREGSPFVQQVAAQSLAQIGAPAVAALIDVLVREQDATTNAAASALLQHYRWSGSSRPARENPPGDSTASARQRAIESLGTCGRTDEVVTKVLAGAALDPAHGVRLASLKALAQADRNLQPALPQLVVCLQDEYAAVRELSARLLGKIGPAAECAIPELTRLTQDKEAAVRRVAQTALGTINVGGFTIIPTPPK